MELKLDSGEWNDDGSSWTPSKGKGSGVFMVTVVSTNGHSCGLGGQAASGEEVSLLYSDNTSATLRFVGAFGKKTKVKPKNIFQKAALDLLRYGQTGEGYIAEVKVQSGATNWTCRFGSSNDLKEIVICPSANCPGQ